MKTILSLILILTINNAFSKEFKELDLNTNSKVTFNVDYMKLSSVDGFFKSFKGTASVDEKETTLSNVKVIIKADSVDTDDPKRDFHVKDHEFFFVSKYPTIEFISSGSTSISKGKNFDLKGTLLLRGVKRPFVFHGLFKGKMAGPDKKEIYFFEFKGELNRQDFGMKWNKELDNGGYLVGDTVIIKINAQGE